MTDRIKRFFRSLRFKVILYLALFVLALIGVLWLFQIVFLGDVYRSIKEKEVHETASVLRAEIASGKTLDNTVSVLTARNQICIEVLDFAFHNVTEKKHNTCYSAGADSICFVHAAMRPSAYSMMDIRYLLLNEVRRSGQVYFKEITAAGVNTEHKDQSKPLGMLYIEYFEEGGRGYYIVLNTKIPPDSATVNTLKGILYAVCAVFALLAVLMALLLSNRISSPIEKIDRAAKRLAKGDYATRFEGGGYAEIAQLRDTLNYASEELSKLEGFRRELLANISHDLRTPLTMIGGYAEVMRDLPGENTPENVQVIIDETNRLTALVNDLLDLSKLQSGAATFEPTRVALTDCVNAIISRYRKLTEIDGYRIVFVYDRDVYVTADAPKLQQVIYNLVNNAVAYTGDDKYVEIRQEIRLDRDTGKSLVRISVIDTGKGISPENLEYIWDRYFKENKTHKRAVVGTGLGLSIVKGVLQMHHARFGVETDDREEHHGSNFWFELEVADADHT